MPKVWLTFSDGQYSIRDLNDPLELEGPQAIYIPDHVYKSYHANVEMWAVIQDVLRHIDNEEYARREPKK